MTQVSGGSGDERATVVELEPPAAATSSSMRPAVRALWVVVVALLLAGPVAAVVVNGRRGASASALATITASASAVDRATTVVLTSTSSTEVEGGQTFAFTTTLAADNEAGVGRSTTTYERLPIASLEVVYTRDALYVRVPEELRDRPGTGGRAWLSATLPPGADAAASNPAPTGLQLLEFLAGAEGEVTEVGREDLRGIATTHYRVGIDAEELLARGRRAQTSLGLTPPRAHTSEPTITTSAADVWLDDAGRMRKMVLTISMDADGAKAVTTTSNEYDYESPVEVEVPAADEAHPAGSIGDAFKVLYAAMDPVGS